jgi:hypothetical protein
VGLHALAGESDVGALEPKGERFLDCNKMEIDPDLLFNTLGRFTILTEKALRRELNF